MYVTRSHAEIFGLVLLFGAAVAGPLLERHLRLLAAVELNYVLNSTGQIGYCVDVHACLYVYSV